ncbi:hypothetical protein JCM11491_000598, partial [Sporobolomyces phaffii]
MQEPRLLRFADSPGSSSDDASARSTYQLLALPPALLALLTAPTPTPDEDDRGPSRRQVLEIRGGATDSAALVTATETYALRGVQNSNSLCICSSSSAANWFERPHDDDDEDDERRPRKRVKNSSDDDNDIEIEAVLHETLEAVVGVARTDKLAAYLEGSEYRGESLDVEAP